MQEEASEKQVLAFARTLRGKSVSERIGQLMLAFDGMDLISAKAAILILEHETKTVGP